MLGLVLLMSVLLLEVFGNLEFERMVVLAGCLGVVRDIPVSFCLFVCFFLVQDKAMVRGVYT